MNLRMERGVLSVRCEEEPQNNGEIKKRKAEKRDRSKEEKEQKMGWTGAIAFVLEILA